MPSVLIVDDEPSARAVLHDLLIPEGLDLTTAASGFEALEIVKHRVPDVIITDLMMPGMDGLELCRRLRAEERTRGTPIVVVTALGSREGMARAVDAGATDFISKPVNGTEVRARIRSMVRISTEYRTLQQLLQLRTDLTNMVIHDLRNPLQVISFSAALMQRSSPAIPPPLLRIRSQVVRLQQLIDNLLLIAKSEAGVLIAQRGEVDAGALIELVLDDCRPAAEEAEIVLHAEVQASRPLDVDSALLRRCIENLVINAVKFSPHQTRVSIVLLQDGQDLQIDVIDEGEGVPESSRESVFERYVTGSSKDRRTQQTGLGLAFCRMVAEAHGGTIKVLPGEPRGSVFRIWIPSVT
ncbi:MAG: hybrid sensor histidine kinase/response regulator [Acidobacteriota bacterium]